MPKHNKRTLAGRTLAPETLMMSYGYDPALSEGSIKAPIFQASGSSRWRTVCGRRSRKRRSA